MPLQLAWHHVSISQLLLTDDTLRLRAVDIPGPAEAIRQVAFVILSTDSFFLFSLGGGSSALVVTCGLLRTRKQSIFPLTDFFFNVVILFHTGSQSGVTHSEKTCPYSACDCLTHHSK